MWIARLFAVLFAVGAFWNLIADGAATPNAIAGAALSIACLHVYLLALTHRPLTLHVQSGVEWANIPPCRWVIAKALDPPYDYDEPVALVVIKPAWRYDPPHECDSTARRSGTLSPAAIRHGNVP